MLIHSIVPNDIIFSEASNKNNAYKHIEYKGQILEVTSMEGEGYKVRRVISTCLKSYLDPELQPGSVLKHSENIKFL